MPPPPGSAATGLMKVLISLRACSAFVCSLFVYACVFVCFMDLCGPN